MKIEAWIALAGFCLALTSSSVGAILWIRQRAQTSIAQKLLKAEQQARQETNAERDFNHLKGNQQQMAQGLALILDEVRDLSQEVSELKTVVLSRAIAPPH